MTEKMSAETSYEDEEEQARTSGLFCFFDMGRPCDASCMAYLTSPPNHGEYIGQQWAKCHLLLNVHKGGKHLTILAQVGGDIARKSRSDIAERQRSHPPMEPR